VLLVITSIENKGMDTVSTWYLLFLPSIAFPSFTISAFIKVTTNRRISREKACFMLQAVFYQYYLINRTIFFL